MPPVVLLSSFLTVFIIHPSTEFVEAMQGPSRQTADFYVVDVPSPNVNSGRKVEVEVNVGVTGCHTQRSRKALPTEAAPNRSAAQAAMHAVVS